MWGQNPQESAEIVASGCPWGDEDGGEALCDASSDGSITDFAEFFFFFLLSSTCVLQLGWKINPT